MMNRLRYFEEIIMSLIHVLPFGLIVCLPSHLEMRERFLLKLLFGIFKRKTKHVMNHLIGLHFALVLSILLRLLN